MPDEIITPKGELITAAEHFGGPDNYLHVLLLNPIRETSKMAIKPVVRASTKEALDAYMEREEVAPYADADGHEKVFRKGGHLEWFNPVQKGSLLAHFMLVPAQHRVDDPDKWQTNIGCLPNVDV